MSLEEAQTLALKVLKQVMEEKLDHNNVQLAQVRPFFKICMRRKRADNGRHAGLAGEGVRDHERGGAQGRHCARRGVSERILSATSERASAVYLAVNHSAGTVPVAGGSGEVVAPREPGLRYRVKKFGRVAPDPLPCGHSIISRDLAKQIGSCSPASRHRGRPGRPPAKPQPRKGPPYLRPPSISPSVKTHLTQIFSLQLPAAQSATIRSADSFGPRRSSVERLPL